MRRSPTMCNSQLRTFALLSVLLASTAALAERADREKAVNLEADRITVDEAKRVHVFEGNVRLSQGSLRIEANRIVVSQDADGFQRGVAVGSPASFRQKREGRDDYVSGEGERVEYDARTERVEFFGNAIVRSGLDEVRGAYIGYDAKEERYLATTQGPQGGAVSGGERVRATIQPRVREETLPAPAETPAVILQATDDLKEAKKQ